jgi:hypothetical protein
MGGFLLELNMQKKRNTHQKRERIIAELNRELLTPRPDALRDDDNFIQETMNNIGSLLCQAEEMGSTDYHYITSQLPIPRNQARDIIKAYRARVYDVKPLVDRWNAAIDEIKAESHRLDAIGQSEHPSQKWSDLMTEILQLARAIDRKTADVRAKDKDIPSYVERTQKMIEGSVRLAYPENEQALRSTRRFFRNMPR